MMAGDYTNRTEDVMRQVGPEAEAMTDPAKQRKALEASVGVNQAMTHGNTGHDAVVEMTRASEMHDIKAITKRLRDAQADQAEARRVGNTEAVQTWQTVINHLQKRYQELQGQTVPEVHDPAEDDVPPQNAAAPASQPAMMQAGAGANDATPGVGR
jgi:hypothetical protein